MASKSKPVFSSSSSSSTLPALSTTNTSGRLVRYKKRQSAVAEVRPYSSPPPPKKTRSVKRSKSTPAPKPKPKPVYSCTISSYEDEELKKEVPLFMAMAGLFVTLTGFLDQKTEDEYVRKVELMCGEITEYIHKTTHVLAGHAHTRKVEHARYKNIPLITPEWVDRLWEDCHQGNNPYLHASLPKYQEFQCPLFYNLYFYFSRHLDESTRVFYQNMAREHGGLFASDFKPSVTSFYICQKAEDEAQTYQAALRKMIPCVSVLFISESVRQKNIDLWQEYEIKPTPKPIAKLNSTFVKEKKELQVNIPQLPILDSSRKKHRMTYSNRDNIKALAPLEINLCGSKVDLAGSDESLLNLSVCGVLGVEDSESDTDSDRTITSDAG